MLVNARCLRLRLFALSRRGLHCSGRLSSRSYADAVTALNGLQSNFNVIEAIRKSGRERNTQAIPEMVEWLRKAGYKPSDLNSLNAIHIAGTKGKGSTAAFVSSILSQYIPQGRFPSLGYKVGLYTSPHLRSVRERIQINNKPISEEKFAQAFFEIWDRLETAESKNGAASDRGAKPVYFRYLTLMAFHTFLEENVKAAVIECGIGGEYDSTNILQAPAVTGITSLGIDHTAVLGPHIEDIAWHKAGILKPGAPAFTVQQHPKAMEVLRSRAQEKGVNMRVAMQKREVEQKAALGLDGDFQRINANLAVELAAAHLKSIGVKDIDFDDLPTEFKEGLRETRLAGRCETREEPGLTWYIDGAHTVESISIVGEWFGDQAAIPRWFANKLVPAQWRENNAELAKKQDGNKDAISPPPPRILLFNQQTRAGMPLLRELLRIARARWEGHFPFSHAVFCSNITFTNAGYKPDLVSINVSEIDVEQLKVQKELAAGWQALVSGDAGECVVHVLPTIEDAVGKCREIATEWGPMDRAKEEGLEKRAKVLVTGSIHLVGGLLEVLETQNRNRGS